MRTIKFRGKVADEPNEWVYGYLRSEDTIYQTEETPNSKACGVGSFKVDPETVGEFTGILDENDKEIYEGDIVKFSGHLRNTWSNEKELQFLTGTVRWVEPCAGLCITNMTKLKDFSWDYDFSFYEIYYCEVIGNIYDNPELKEAKNDEKIHK